MKIEKFEDIIAWQRARELTKIIYQELRNSRDFGFRDQMQRASVSIMNNIAEGFERKGNKELKNFLFIAKGSSAEVRSMSYLAFDLQYITKQQHDKLLSMTDEIARLLSGFIKTL